MNPVNKGLLSTLASFNTQREFDWWPHLNPPDLPGKCSDSSVRAETLMLGVGPGVDRQQYPST